MKLIDLDSPEWVGLSHAYGSAHDIPEFSKAISQAPEAHGFDSDVLSSLWRSLCHQGEAMIRAFAVSVCLAVVAFAPTATAQSPTLEDIIAEYGPKPVSADCSNAPVMGFKKHLAYTRPGEEMQSMQRRHLAPEWDAFMRAKAVEAGAKTQEHIDLFFSHWSVKLPDPSTNLKFYRTRDFTGCERGGLQ